MGAFSVDRYGNVWLGGAENRDNPSARISEKGEAFMSGEAPTPEGRVESIKEAWKRWNDAGHKTVSLKEGRRRFDICKKCEYLKLGQCQLCKCFMRGKCLLAGMVCKDKPPRW